MVIKKNQVVFINFIPLNKLYIDKILWLLYTNIKEGIMTYDEENNLILKTMLRIQLNSLIVEIENLTEEQLNNKSILETYKDSLNNALLYYFNYHILNDSNVAHKKKLQELKEKLQLKILSLELDEIGSHKPPIAIVKNNESKEI